MIGIKVAVQTKCLAQPLRQALHTASRLGGEGVQLDLRHELPAAELSDTALRQLRKLLDDLNVRVASTAFPTRRGYAETQDLDRRIDATRQALGASSKLGARVMLISLGPLPPPDEPPRSTLLEAITALAASGNRFGVQLALQCPAAHPADLKGFLEELPDGLVGVDLSPADLILNNRQPREFLERLGPQVVHTFANDAVRGLGGAAGSTVELGRGMADVEELLGLLEEHDYRGWLTVERRNSPRPTEEVANAIQFLRAL
ncbi:MAG TPA: TIM barrel protein [Lacipirellula sp.]